MFYFQNFTSRCNWYIIRAIGGRMLLLDYVKEYQKRINKPVAKKLLEKTNSKTITEMLNKLKSIDIIEFVNISECVNWELTEVQKEILRNLISYPMSILLCGKGSGKTSLVAIAFQYVVFRLMLEDERRLNRLDLLNIAPNADLANTTFFRELKQQLSQNLLFNFIKLTKIQKNKIYFFPDSDLEEYIIIHSANSSSASFEGKNVYMAVIDEISDSKWKNPEQVFNDLTGSIFTRFEDGILAVITWTRFYSSNPMSDCGFKLFMQYKDDPKVYTTRYSHKECRGKNPAMYDPHNPIHRRMYDCQFEYWADRMINTAKFKWTNNKLFDLDIYTSADLVRFKLKYLNVKNNTTVHIDTSISNDKTVISLYDNANNIIDIEVIEPTDGYKVSYEDLDILIRSLNSNPRIKKITMDSFNSEYFIQKYNKCQKMSFSQKEQFNALMMFKKLADDIKFNNKYKDLIVYQFSNIEIDIDRWHYVGDGSSDVVDAVIYAIYNTRTDINKSKRHKVGFVF